MKKFSIEDQITGNFDFDIQDTQVFLREIEKELKKEFIGIDREIEELVKAVKPWLFFRKTLQRPMIINRWGMTGCGKTDLIMKMFRMLGLENTTYHINGSQLNGEFPLRNVVHEHFMKNRYPVVVLDEFQNYRCKSSMNEEYEKYNSLVWDFMDTGRVTFNAYHIIGKGEEFFGISSIISIMNMLLYFENNSFNRLSFTLSKEELDILHQICGLMHPPIGGNSEGCDYPSKLVKINSRYTEHLYISCEVMRYLQTYFVRSGDTFTLSDMFLRRIVDLLKCQRIRCSGDMKDYLRNMSFREFVDLMYHLNNDLLTNYRDFEMDYSQALIIVIGNIDEAYYGSASNVSPDIDADEFAKVCKQVNSVKIKEALCTRFRPEHIGRLGNVHIISGSLSSESYRKIIRKQMNEYADFMQETYSFKLVFSDEIYDFIYREAVFPTLGVRCITSTINNIIKPVVSDVMVLRMEKNIASDTLFFKSIKTGSEKTDMKTKFFIVDLIENGEVRFSYQSNKIDIRVDCLRENRQDDMQAVIAVHEAGHAVAHIVLFKRIPLVIHSVSSADGGFTWRGIENRNIMNMKSLENEVMVELAGLVAEETVFGRDMITNGSREDIKAATGLLMMARRQWAMRDSITYTDIAGRDNDVRQEFDDTTGRSAESEMVLLRHKTRNLLSNYRELLLHIADYISDNSSIDCIILKEMVKKYSDFPVQCLENESSPTAYGYRKILKDTVGGLEIFPPRQ
jgi:cell division protease FtsH